VGWRKPNYYWIGIGSFGTQRRITVSADKVIPMLKRYLQTLPQIDPEFAQFCQSEPQPEVVDEWAQESLEAKYAQLTTDEVLSTLAEDVASQVMDVRELGEQLREILNGLEQMDAAQVALDELLKRAERINDLIAAGLERQRVQSPVITESEPLEALVLMNGHKA
jgi:hypothetical protein